MSIDHAVNRHTQASNELFICASGPLTLYRHPFALCCASPRCLAESETPICFTTVSRTRTSGLDNSQSMCSPKTSLALTDTLCVVRHSRDKNSEWHLPLWAQFLQDFKLAVKLGMFLTRASQRDTHRSTWEASFFPSFVHHGNCKFSDSTIPTGNLERIR